MPKFPTPTRPGYYWAKLVHPTRMPEGEDWKSFDWEVVEVFENTLDETDEEHLMASVPGIGPAQAIDGFCWGPEVLPHPDLTYKEITTIRRKNWGRERRKC